MATRKILLVFALLASAKAASAQTQTPDRTLTPTEAKQFVRAMQEKDRQELADRHAKTEQALITYWSSRTIAERDKLTKKKPKVDPCTSVQRIFIRRNRLDTYQYRKGLDTAFSQGYRGRKDATGGLFSFSKDQISDVESVTIGTRASIVLAERDPASPCHTISGYPELPEGQVRDPFAPENNPPSEGIVSWLVAGWIDAQGTTNKPKRANEQSSLQSGVDLQFQVLAPGIFDSHYFTLTPYAISDLRGQASGFGFRGGWEPIAPGNPIRLGGRFGAPDPYFDWFWNLRAEVDYRDVNETGATSLLLGNQTWFGGYVNYKFFLFPSFGERHGALPLPYPDLADRFFGTVSFQYHWNSMLDTKVRKTSIELGYNLTQDGYTALSFQYSIGNDKDNLAKTDKYTAGLTVKY